MGDGIIQILIIGIIFIIIILLAVLFFMYMKNKMQNKEEEETETTSDKTKDERFDKKSVFKFMEFDTVEDNMICQDNGTKYLMVVECKGINYDLLSALEKTSVEQGFLQFLNTLKNEIQIYIQTRKVNLTQSVSNYQLKVDQIKESLRYEENKLEDMQRLGGYDRSEVLKQIKEVTKKRNLLEYGEDLINNTQQMAEDKDITTKQYYIIIPYYTEEITSVGDYDKREICSMAFSELYTRAQSIVSALSECEVRGRILNSQELVELLYVAYNREQYDIYDFETYMTQMGVQSLYSTSEDVLDKRAKALDEEIVEKGRNKAIQAYEMVSSEIRKKRQELEEREQSMEKYIDEYANKIVDNEESIIGRPMAERTRAKISEMTEKREREKSKNLSTDENAEKPKVKRQLTDEERRRRLAIRRKKLLEMKAREKNGSKQE